MDIDNYVVQFIRKGTLEKRLKILELLRQRGEPIYQGTTFEVDTDRTSVSYFCRDDELEWSTNSDAPKKCTIVTLDEFIEILTKSKLPDLY